MLRLVKMVGIKLSSCVWFMSIVLPLSAKQGLLCFPGNKVGRFTSESAADLNKTFGISMFPDNCNFRSTFAVSDAAFLLCSELSSLSTGLFFWWSRYFPERCLHFAVPSASRTPLPTFSSLAHTYCGLQLNYFPYVWKSICNSSLELVIVGLLWLRFALRYCQVEHQRWAPFYVRFVSVRVA